VASENRSDCVKRVARACIQMHSRSRSRASIIHVHATIPPAHPPVPPRPRLSFPSRFVDIRLLQTRQQYRYVTRRRRAPRRQARATRRHGSPISNRDRTCHTDGRENERRAHLLFSLCFLSFRWVSISSLGRRFPSQTDRKLAVRCGMQASEWISLSLSFSLFLSLSLASGKSRTKLGHSRSLPRNVAAARLYSRARIDFLLSCARLYANFTPHRIFLAALCTRARLICLSCVYVDVCVRASLSVCLSLSFVLSGCSSRRRYRDRCATRVTVRRAAASRSRGRQCGAPLRELTASGVMTNSS